jgi:hypothetical protein
MLNASESTTISASFNFFAFLWGFSEKERGTLEGRENFSRNLPAQNLIWLAFSS